MTLYYAVNATGQSIVFTDVPERDDHFKCWKGTIIGCYSMMVGQLEAEGEITLPVLTWKDESVKLELNLKVC